MKINVKATIHFNGHEYSSADQMPPEAQLAYREASMTGAVSLTERLDKIVLNAPMLAGARRGHHIYDDIMRVVENNGQVTLPLSADGRFGPRQLKFGLAFVGLLGVVAFVVWAIASR